MIALGIACGIILIVFVIAWWVNKVIQSFIDDDEGRFFDNNEN